MSVLVEHIKGGEILVRYMLGLLEFDQSRQRAHADQEIVDVRALGRHRSVLRSVRLVPIRQDQAQLWQEILLMHLKRRSHAGGTLPRISRTIPNNDICQATKTD